MEHRRLLLVRSELLLLVLLLVLLVLLLVRYRGQSYGFIGIRVRFEGGRRGCIGGRTWVWRGIR